MDNNPFRANSGHQVQQTNSCTNDTCYNSLSPQGQRTSGPLIGNTTMSTFDPLLERQSYHQVSQLPQSGQYSAQQYSTAQPTSTNHMHQALFSPMSTGTNPSFHGYNFAGNSYTQTEFGQGFMPSTQLTQQPYQQVHQIQQQQPFQQVQQMQHQQPFQQAHQMQHQQPYQHVQQMPYQHSQEIQTQKYRHAPVDASSLLQSRVVRRVECPVCHKSLEGDDPAINHHVNEHYT
ncbi:hypothetical protein [Absidia glauca]|uniref:Uncharacterized protein n=1 Tax=Absidia glauca TaxID=4829 RepID=A0A163KBB9_ABSGL|nr:hypothetical protein [Absidia glauca]